MRAPGADTLATRIRARANSPRQISRSSVPRPSTAPSSRASNSRPITDATKATFLAPRDNLSRRAISEPCSVSGMVASPSSSLCSATDRVSSSTNSGTPAARVSMSSIKAISGVRPRMLVINSVVCSRVSKPIGNSIALSKSNIQSEAPSGLCVTTRRTGRSTIPAVNRSSTS